MNAYKQEDSRSKIVVKHLVKVRTVKSRPAWPAFPALPSVAWHVPNGQDFTY